MNNLQFKDGLLYTSIILKHGDKSVLVDDVIIDTGEILLVGGFQIDY